MSEPTISNAIFDRKVQEKDFNKLYRTADILICESAQGITYLSELTSEEKINLFSLTDKVSTLKFKNWKEFYTENESYSTYRVHKDIELYLDNLKFSNGYSYNLGTMQDITKSGVFGNIQNLVEGANQMSSVLNAFKNNENKASEKEFASRLQYQDRVNIYKNIPYFQDISTSSIDTLSFSFSWGQYELYNCELEVVKPIFALANCFGNSIDSNGYVLTPFDAKFEVTSKAYAALFKGAKNTLADLRNERTSYSSNKIRDLTKTLNSLYTSVAGQTSVRAALIRVGGAIFGPVYVSDVTWEFDYSQQDEYGMPYKGKITLGGIKPVLIDDMSTFKLSGGLKNLG